jgi:hypothetical protein
MISTIFIKSGIYFGYVDFGIELMRLEGKVDKLILMHRYYAL